MDFHYFLIREFRGNSQYNILKCVLTESLTVTCLKNKKVDKAITYWIHT